MSTHEAVGNSASRFDHIKKFKTLLAMKSAHSNTVKTIGRDSPYLNEVKALWRKHADTLGFFPDGAFEEYAAKKQIVVAVDDSGAFLGYLLFRITLSSNNASIVHLCVDPNKQRQGIAALLVKELIHQTKILRGISPRCRRDFQASKLWPRLGFVPVSDKVGKSSSGSTLTHWWFGHNHPDLLSLAQEKELEQKLKVVIDANVFFDLQKKSNEESMALVADWLEDSIAICITDEILNEINRSPNGQERIESRNFVSQFPTLTFNQDDFDNINALLDKYLWNIHQKTLVFRISRGAKKFKEEIRRLSSSAELPLSIHARGSIARYRINFPI